MPSPLETATEAESQIDQNGGVLIPLLVRRALKLQADDRVGFHVALDGSVTVRRIGPGRTTRPRAQTTGLPQAIAKAASMLAGPAGARLSKADPVLMNQLRDIVGSAFNPALAADRSDVPDADGATGAHQRSNPRAAS